MKKIFITLLMVCAVIAHASASDHKSRLMIGTGLMYPNSWDATVSYEYETKYHNAWEFFANGNLKWSECSTCGHVCPETFWHGYRTWGFGAAYKPCVIRGMNHHGNLRLGASLGSDMHHVLGGFHAGYEHDYDLPGGWQLFWQVKVDLMVKGQDLFRSGVAIGFKIPL